ncbi:MAG TPA: MotA/TolQ/ExbB proton channel family protein [Candidatus Cloacimonadota bacterium]|jgi:biopolymer transport protein ExbB|nr:MotA/TolQ/ExbB proton channel family protein [Candidatus Cloacimonadota bacterium]HOF59333.1 MotA/TolQ/ExbB proton channel family protein [Candidatus Cloacimonadota bacterium]HOR58348.1 MotA/TolQ/ExbB proton channel family protein [Candidatus Cloacimonadota bacterium]HPB08710.1 MotA/TolQ/ExbB proton channel family protein [Candidatus Cloacimonadota bacterium]HQL12592.1 MotA/TolQ/ExbB proton channel family protein [Candidatus Cloacimonadota bacterium]
MRKRFSKVLMLIVVMSALLMSLSHAQAPDPAAAAADTVAEVAEPVAEVEQQAVETSSGAKGIAEFLFGRGLVNFFINGGWVMWPILMVAIYGLAYVIWKFITLMYAKINLNGFLNQVVPLIKEKKYKEAIEIAKKTRGPVASIVYEGLLKSDRGVDAVEKSMENAAMIEMSYLEKGFVEISTAITLAPMLGFFGTVDGMVVAFDAIAKARSVDATIVASGIKIALITTEAGLAVAIPIQLLSNIFMTQVDGLVIDMQRASEKVIEAMIES